MNPIRRIKSELKAAVFAVVVFSTSTNLHSATIGYGNAFGNFLSSSGSSLTEGGISVGFFTVALPTTAAIASISNLNYTTFSSTFGFVDVRTMRDINNNLPTWVSGGWDFVSGFTGGTLTVPATPSNPPAAAFNHSDSLTTFAAGATSGTALWVVAFNKGNYANSFAGSTEWALVTGTAPGGTANDWIYPTSSENIQLSQVNAAGEILAGTDGASVLGGNTDNVYLTVIPEPNSATLLGLGGLVLFGIRRLTSQKLKNSGKIAAASYLIFGMTFLGLDLRAQSTVSTPVVGFQKISLPVGGKAFAPTFIKANVFQGSATISGSTVSVAANSLAGLTLGPTEFSNRENYPRFYAEVTQANSPFYGYNFDITAANTSSAFTSGNIPVGLSGTVTIAIRPHLTLADLSPASLASGDSITVANDPSGAVSTYYVYNGGWIGSDFNTSKSFSHVIIPPGNGLIYSGQDSELQLILSGVVKSTPTAVPVYQNAYANLVAPVNPSAAINYASQNIASGIGSGAAFTVYSGDGSFVEENVYYSTGSGLLDGSFTSVSTVNVPGATAVSVGSLNSDSVWIIPPAINP